jgi:transposase
MPTAQEAQEMIPVEDREQIRIAYFIEEKSKRQIAKEQHCSPKTIRKALGDAEAQPYQRTVPYRSPVLGPYHARIDELLAENESLPRKQRRTTHQIYLQLRAEQYGGSESSVRTYIWLKRKHAQRMEVYLPLEFDPGDYAQADWGEAQVWLAEEQLSAQLFVMRLCYSRRTFVRAYPTQRQEAFFDGHAGAFEFFGGVPRHLTYDNLTTAVQQVLMGQQRAEQRQFIALRSHYVFESRFCTPGEGHEKGGVESAVGYVRRNFLSPPPHVSSWDALNAHLLHCCQADDMRVVAGQAQAIGERFAQERAQLGVLPAHPFACCVTKEVTLNKYSQVAFETNRYSVPSDQAYKQLTLKAYPFQVVIQHGGDTVCSHPRSYQQHQEIVNWLDYLPLLAQRPGAFEHAKALREARSHWPPLYEQLLTHLQRTHADHSSAVREFVLILGLLREHPAELVEAAIGEALQFGCVHLDGVKLCLQQRLAPARPVAILDLQQRPQLQSAGMQPLDLRRYDELLSQGGVA